MKLSSVYMHAHVPTYIHLLGLCLLKIFLYVVSYFIFLKQCPSFFPIDFVSTMDNLYLYSTVTNVILKTMRKKLGLFITIFTETRIKD